MYVLDDKSRSINHIPLSMSYYRTNQNNDTIGVRKCRSAEQDELMHAGRKKSYMYNGVEELQTLDYDYTLEQICN